MRLTQWADTVSFATLVDVAFFCSVAVTRMFGYPVFNLASDYQLYWCAASKI